MPIKDTEEISNLNNQMEKIDNFNLKIPDKFDSLSQLQDFLSTLQARINSGEINPLNVDFIPIFQAFQDLIKPENLEEIISDFKDSSTIFQDKINYIKVFINRIASEDKLRDFIENSKDETFLSRILGSVWKNLFLVETIPLQYF
jgi:proline dehydrogenase